MAFLRVVGAAVLIALLAIAGIYGASLLRKRLVVYSGRSSEAAEDFAKTKVSMSMLSSELSRVLKQQPTNLMDVSVKLRKDPYAPECLISSTNPFPSILPPGHYEWRFTAEGPEHPIDSPLLWRKFPVWGGTVVFLTFAGEVQSMPTTNWVGYLRERKLTVDREADRP